MKYRNLILAALISVVSIACQKENIEEPTNQKESNTKVEYINNPNRRSLDDEFILLGSIRKNNGKNILTNGEVEIIDSITNQHVKTVFTDQEGEFLAKVTAGSYILECYEDGSYVGKSDEIHAHEDLRVEVNLEY